VCINILIRLIKLIIYACLDLCVFNAIIVVVNVCSKTQISYIVMERKFSGKFRMLFYIFNIYIDRNNPSLRDFDIINVYTNY